MSQSAILFTIIVPTHNHSALLSYALASIAQQSLKNFEVFIIGDGATKETEAAAQKFCAHDARFSWFSFPKSKRTGEQYRHELITSKAKGKYIAYLADDDLWHSKHLQVMRDALETNDFCAALYASFYDDKTLKVKVHSISHPDDQETLKRGENFMPLSTVAHTKERYLQLPFGWRTTPLGTPTDLYMWQQWVNQKNVRFVDAQTLSVLNFPAPPRKNWSDNQREAELKHWLKAITSEKEWLLLHEKIVNYLLEQISEFKSMPEKERLKRYKAEDELNRLRDAKLVRLYIQFKALFTGAKF